MTALLSSTPTRLDSSPTFTTPNRTPESKSEKSPSATAARTLLHTMTDKPPSRHQQYDEDTVSQRKMLHIIRKLTNRVTWSHHGRSFLCIFTATWTPLALSIILLSFIEGFLSSMRFPIRLHNQQVCSKQLVRRIN